MARGKRKFPSEEITSLSRDYFVSLEARNYAEASRLLERMKGMIKEDDRSRGYFNALEGMRVALASGDGRYSLIFRLSKYPGLDKLKREFDQRVRNPLSADFDRGFFKAWSEYIDFLRGTLTE